MVSNIVIPPLREYFDCTTVVAARGLEFEVIAAVVIGGTSLYGGQGNILRTIIGVIIIALIRNFLNLSRIDIFWQDFATGAIIIAAVLLDALQKRVGRG